MKRDLLLKTSFFPYSLTLKKLFQNTKKKIQIFLVNSNIRYKQIPF